MNVGSRRATRAYLMKRRWTIEVFGSAAARDERAEEIRKHLDGADMRVYQRNLKIEDSLVPAFVLVVRV